VSRVVVRAELMVVLEAPEAWLVAVGARRDPAAFRSLFEHFAPRLKGFFVRGGLDPARADELVQEVLVRVWVHARSYDPARASANTWVFTIARNTRIDVARRDSVRATALPDDGASGGPEGPLVALQSRHEAAALRAALQELPDGQRVVLERAYFEERSLSEIAAQEGLPLGTVKSRVRLAFERLRVALGAAR
jgi:RNA polymerase sigma factor (sigma-70 family)